MHVCVDQCRAMMMSVSIKSTGRLVKTETVNGAKGGAKTRTGTRTQSAAMSVTGETRHGTSITASAAAARVAVAVVRRMQGRMARRRAGLHLQSRCVSLISDGVRISMCGGVVINAVGHVQFQRGSGGLMPVIP